jgi:ubiquinone/menaquinone biosynthesis C-methylase UbiE
MVTKRLEKERSFHDKRFNGADSERKRARKYYSVNMHTMNRYFEIISMYCTNKKLLEYGCGTGSGSEQWLKFGAILVGIDISPKGIKIAKERLKNTKYDADYFVMNAENTGFNDSSFDIVVGTGIIHHLDILHSYQELCRILKKNGHAVFMEPLGHNPFINLYRALTPKMRTEDEHPLKLKDIEILKQCFYNVDVEYFSLFTLLAVPFRSMFFFDKLCCFFRNIDKMAFQIPFIKRYAWMVIIHASNPKKGFLKRY